MPNVKSNIIVCPACRTENIEGADLCQNCMADLHAIGIADAFQAPSESDLSLPLSSLRLSRARTATPQTSVRDAITVMRDDPTGAVVVVNNGVIAGIFTDRDVLKRVAGRPETLEQPISTVMTADPVLLDEAAAIAVALNKMGVGGFRHIPVTRDGALLAIVTGRDVMSWLIGRYFDESHHMDTKP